MSAKPEFDLVLYGATGFTGRLVAEYLATRDHGLKWALAGRDRERLESLAAEIGHAGLPILLADANDQAALGELVRRTRLVLATAGPFHLYGSPLVAVCAAAGTDYVNISGEPAWAHDMILRHQPAAQASGARLLLSAGFDSIPFELGVLALQRLAVARSGKALSSVSGRVRAFNGTLSGGTIAAGLVSQQLAKDEAVRAVLMNPFALTPGFEGPKQPAMHKIRYDDALGVWLTPFMMAPINTKNLHRSSYLMGHAYGEQFQYDEMEIAGSGEPGRQRAEELMQKDRFGGPNAPKPGEGPSKHERETGSYDILFYGRHEDGELLKIAVRGDRDPGYGSTAKMVSETALMLLESHGQPGGGFWLPGAALGTKLIDRLETHAGLAFTRED
ncbi:MAG: Saccharopine dehydrogenase [Hydrocarboniphaga sp.]|uniref:saccharopine dehydrogenase family protein n=1 Tax=Hydrocarboniphaga sp. TaxID=2033016 RepID=UPI002602B97D|nr:saccharopine dehydrogenase NADP-binding domain-containing protein [Hydrocarboniphaga sp.]MDB5971155.1 Saccharopine dehydrogenase [Hydrocarboniphaga sp.]